MYADAWLISRLEGDPTLAGLISGVYSEIIPAGRSLPAVRFHVQMANDTLGVGAHRILTHLTYLVVGVYKGTSPAPLLPIADRIDNLLHGASGSTVDIDVLSVVRSEPFSMSDFDSGEHYWHVGGMYKFTVNKQ